MPDKPRFLVYLSYLMFAIFIFGAIVQYNDPDPLLWIGVYGVAALLTWFFIIDRLNWRVPAVAAAALILWAAFLLPEVWGIVSIPDLFDAWEMKNMAIETAREAGGILIIAVWLLVLGWYTFKKSDYSGVLDQRNEPKDL